MQIGGIQKTSLLDYPEKISAIVFTPGCNLRCGYCHNPELIFNPKPSFSEEAFFEFLHKRTGKIDAVVITGGEPCLQTDLMDFVKKIKELGYLVKLDTNGTFPNKVKDLLDNNLLDYIAMDIKAPLEKYNQITNVKVDTEKIAESILLLKNSKIGYEFRTTVVKSQLNIKDFEKIAEILEGAERYYLQKFISSKILDKSLENQASYTDEEFLPIVEILRQKIKFVEIR